MYPGKRLINRKQLIENFVLYMTLQGANFYLNRKRGNKTAWFVNV